MIDDIKKDAASRMAKSVESLGENLAKVRTGRAACQPARSPDGFLLWF